MANDFCPCCGRHCPLSDPHCERGREYAKSGSLPKEQVEHLRHERDEGAFRHGGHHRHGGGHDR